MLNADSQIKTEVSENSYIYLTFVKDSYIINIDADSFIKNELEEDSHVM